mgnify:CR=1 FL=1
MLLELMLIVYLLVGGGQPFLNHVAKVRQFSDTTKFHPAELC